jgi:GTP-binding protein HflX
METKPPIPLAVLVGIQTPEVDDVAHEASLEELGRLVKTLGYEVVGTVSQKREGTGAGSLLGSGKLAELAALTGGTGVVGSMAPPPKSKARQRFEGVTATIDQAESDSAGPGLGAPRAEPSISAGTLTRLSSLDGCFAPILGVQAT